MQASARVAQPAHRRRRCRHSPARSASAIRKCASRFSRRSSAIRRAFGDASANGDGGDSRQDRPRAAARWSCRTDARAFPGGAGRSRAGSRTDRRRQRESRDRAPAGQRCGESRQVLLPRRRRRHRPVRPAPQPDPAAASVRGRPASHVVSMVCLRPCALVIHPPSLPERPSSTDKPGIGRQQDQAGRHGTSSTALARLRPRPEPGCDRLCFQPDEALGDALAVDAVGNAGAIVGDASADLAALLRQRHRDRRRCRSAGASI